MIMYCNYRPEYESLVKFKFSLEGDYPLIAIHTDDFWQVATDNNPRKRLLVSPARYASLAEATTATEAMTA